MPTHRTLHFVEDGPAHAPSLLLGPALGTSLQMWDQQVPHLTPRHHVVRWDLPGHGGSPRRMLRASATVADLATLVLRLADSLGIDRFAYAGACLSGAVGLHLAVHHPDRLSSLAVVGTSAHFGAPQPWRERIIRVKQEGLLPMAGAAAEGWFTEAFRMTDRARALAADHLAVDPAGYSSCCHAVAALDLRRSLSGIALPTLVIVGARDLVTPPKHARELTERMPDAVLVTMSSAAHLPGVEHPDAVGKLLADFLANEFEPQVRAVDVAAATHSAGEREYRQAPIPLRTIRRTEARVHFYVQLTALAVADRGAELNEVAREAARAGVPRGEIVAVLREALPHSPSSSHDRIESLARSMTDGIHLPAPHQEPLADAGR